MFSNGKVTMSDAEFEAMQAHDAKQAAKLTEQRACIAELEAANREWALSDAKTRSGWFIQRIAELEKERDYYRDLAQRRSR